MIPMLCALLGSILCRSYAHPILIITDGETRKPMIINSEVRKTPVYNPDISRKMANTQL